jgi:branched-chain amino acid transport system permease protein
VVAQNSEFFKNSEFWVLVLWRVYDTLPPMLCGPTVACSDVVLQLLIIGLTNGSVIALNAIGFTLIYGITRTINLAHGDLFALTTVLVTQLILALEITAASPPPVLLGALLLVLGVAAAFGLTLNLGIERLAFWPFRGRSRLAPLIATLGFSFILYQGALVWRYLLPNWIPGEHRSVPGIPEFPRDSIPEVLPATNLLQGVSAYVRLVPKDILVVALAAALALGVHWFLQSTRFGRAIRACSQNVELARICGLNPDAVIRQTFMLGGALAGAAAFVFSIYYAHPFANHGVQSGLVAFAAAILGGIGSPVGALASGLVLGVLAAFSDYFWDGRWTPVLIQALLVGLLLVRPTGFAASDTEEDLSRTDRDAVAAPSPSRLSPASQKLLWGLLFIGLLFPLLDNALGWHQHVIATGIAIFALLALGLNVLLGFAGLLDLGYAVSFGLGAYLTGLLTSRYTWVGAFLPQPVDFIFVLSVSALAAGLFGALNGLLTLRLRSDYLAIVTLALGQLLRQTLANLSSLTGGNNGLSAIPAPSLLTHVLSLPIERYYLALGLVIVGTLMSQRLLRSRTGRAWLASTEDEIAAASMGVPVARYRTLAFVVGMALAGMAGALYASSFTYVDPDLIDFRVSAMVLAMVILGGAGSVPGAILGAALIATYDRLALPLLGEWLGRQQGAQAAAIDIRGLSYLNFGLALYLTVLFRARR